MKFGYVYPGGDAREAAQMARLAEESGWDGFFVWDPVWGVDAWVTLAAAAVQTQKIRLGTMITPVSRRRPWKLASETAALDRLSEGRLILAVGLGAIDTGFIQFGEITDRRQRAELLDEGLAILTGLWQGQPFQFDGKHYHVNKTDFLPPPPPIQQPRIPIWVVGAWPRPKSMRRVVKFDGLLPDMIDDQGKHIRPTPLDIQYMLEYIQINRDLDTPFDIVMEGDTSQENPDSARDIVREWAGAGVTWWLEAQWSLTETMWDPKTQGKISQRLRLGPPHIV